MYLIVVVVWSVTTPVVLKTGGGGGGGGGSQTLSMSLSESDIVFQCGTGETCNSVKIFVTPY